MAWPRLALCVALLALVVGCTRLPDAGVTQVRPKTLADLRTQMLAARLDLDQFRLRGPYSVTTREDLHLQLADGGHVDTDLYLSDHGEKAPLIVLLHGHDNSKEDHAYQALHLATWGLHGLALRLPKEGPWDDNGRTLADLVELIHRSPGILDSRIDTSRIVLVGHSFGGSAAAIALGAGTPALGAILLDPAGIGAPLPEFLRRIRSPVVIIGADASITLTRDRSDFYDLIRRDIVEVSIVGAHHEDAQFPMEPPLQLSGTDPARREAQFTFVSALTAAAFSLGFTGKIDAVWTSFDDATRKGTLFETMRK